MTMDIYQHFSGKSIFFTGVTGFVGKVLLFKLLKEFKDLKNVFVLVRPKKNQTPMQRFEKEVLSSPCFDPLIKEIGQDEWKRRIQCVVPVAGDILQDGLGLSEQDTVKIAASCTHIIHLAATVDFMEKLNMSVKMNVLGTLRVMALAKKCQNIESVVHTSTCYVNWNRHGDVPVKETLYPLPFDAEAMCKYILSIDESLIAQEQARLMQKYGFPNTYTLTKRMTEHILYQTYRNELPLTIVRPAIIGSSFKEPCPGWVDALTAAGGIFLTAGLGILHELEADPNKVCDVVPVDFVVNTLIKAAYKTAMHKKPTVTAPEKTLAARPSATTASIPVIEAKAAGATVPGVAAAGPSSNILVAAGAASVKAESVAASDSGSTMPFVFASCTSNTLNACSWGLCARAVISYWKANRHEKAISTPDMILTTSKLYYNFRWYMYRRIPFEVMKVAANLPAPIGSPSKQKLVKRYARALFRADDLNFQFKPFTTKWWYFDNANTKFLDEGMPNNNFNTDTYDINWHNYTQQYQYGMIKYIMRSPGDRFQPPVPLSGSELFLKASL